MFLLQETWVESFQAFFPTGNYMLKVSNRNITIKINNRNIRKQCEICSKLTIKTLEWRQWCRSGVFIVNFEHIDTLF